MTYLIAMNYQYHDRQSGKSTDSLKTSIVQRNGAVTVSLIKKLETELADEGQKIIGRGFPHVIVTVDVIAVSQLAEEPITETEKEY